MADTDDSKDKEKPDIPEGEEEEEEEDILFDLVEDPYPTKDCVDKDDDLGKVLLTLTLTQKSISKINHVNFDRRQV